jgi:GNAT superfamily N-acetyltransferase
MNIEVQRVEYADIERLRDAYRREANCQIVHDSILRRGMADPWLILVDGAVGGYGGVWNTIHPGRVMEFHTLPRWRASALPMFREFIAASGATEVEAQTNMPLMLLMLYDVATDIAVENYLFHDGCTTQLPNPGGEFRATREEEKTEKMDADWVFVIDGTIAASGGFLTHYNPPYGDIYMHVAESSRRRGIGSYFVQEAKRVCYEAGRVPAARCNADNIPSRLTLQKAGMLPCGRLLSGKIAGAQRAPECIGGTCEPCEFTERVTRVQGHRRYAGGSEHYVSLKPRTSRIHSAAAASSLRSPPRRRTGRPAAALPHGRCVQRSTSG